MKSTAHDLSYASQSTAQKLDIYLPSTGNAPFPLVIFIHGGAFLYGDKANVEGHTFLLEMGYAVASINYRLSEEAKFPTLIRDAKAAVRWLRANASEYGLDPERFAAWGSSAGGYLVAMLGTTSGVAEFEDATLGNSNFSSRVQAVVDWFGPTDFLKMDEQLAEGGFEASFQTHSNMDSPESLLLGGPILENPELVKAANPATYVTSDCPPFLIEHGTADSIVPCQQSQLLYDTLLPVLGPEKVTLHYLAGVGHGGPEFISSENMELVLEFLAKHLK